ncbi:MAG: DNA methyltransferase [Desulfuromonadales bacterium GWC2_61_20]|nr:MAG: DNA methyltransferase [Desulfuromonadales bacterium GWC2_61_20]
MSQPQLPTSPDQTVTDFLRRWEASGAAERANYQLFLSELCDLLGVQRPNPTGPFDRDNAYVFERSVAFAYGDGSSSVGRIDLYKRGCFVLEAKQGSDRVEPQVKEPEPGWLTARRGTAVRGTKGWDVAMLKAKGQAEQYARALPVEEGWPPFLVVVDVGHAIELYSEFSCTGKTYLPFPDPRSYRIPLADLAHAPIRERLRLIWTTPHSLDPAKQSAKATRQVAERLATLAKSLEQAGHGAEAVGNFLKRCLFTMFAEDIGLIPHLSFTTLLGSLKGQADAFAPMAASLWTTMKDGGFSTVLREKLLRFNGGLFEDATALPINEEQLALLMAAAKADWRDVEPAIFGTLLERALDPTERHHLGAHYTPREYVERLVLPTVIEPLRGDWEAVLAGAVTLDAQGDKAGAIALVKTFHRTLCNLRILDPACGSGNFLYVTFEHLKRLEGEVLNALEGFGEEQTTLELAGLTVDPHQLLGIEVNPRAAAITDMVLWIGYLQWHFRTRGHVLPPEPVIKKFHNVECRDAVLAYDGVEPVVDGEGRAVSRWDGRTTKVHPVTGEQVPDEAAQEPVLRYLNPRQAEWPAADFVVGNPPFIGNKRMRNALGDGYVEALRNVWNDVPDTADFVMYWWNKAAELTRLGKLRRFGFITTNSVTMAFNRKIVERHLIAHQSISLAFAIPDHPWVDSVDGAAVRIAMTVGKSSQEGNEGSLITVTSERDGDGEGVAVELSRQRGVLHADLTAGANVAGVLPLLSNSGISFMGMIPLGAGFWIDEQDAVNLGFGRVPGLEAHIRRYRNGKDLTDKPRGILALDFYGITEGELRQRFPEAYQWVLERVKPQRDQDKRPSRRDNWWFFAEAVPKFRLAAAGLKRYIGTAETAKHRMFVFLDADILPDQKIRTVASDDAYLLGVLSSRVHITWALAAGGTLEDRPVYNTTRCFEPFPFPAASNEQKQTIRDLAEQLDAHRKRQQALYPDLTLTGMYNVLEKLREIEIPPNPPLTKGGVGVASRGILTAKEKIIHEQGLVSVLKQLHDELDAAVFAAYGWPATLTDAEILERVVALNRERAREEEQGLIRWLRPEYQQPHGEKIVVQDDLDLGASETAPAAPKAKLLWPKTLPEQVQAVRAALAGAAAPLTAETIARTFQRARADKVGELLETLAALGQVREVAPGSFVV